MERNWQFFKNVSTSTYQNVKVGNVLLTANPVPGNTTTSARMLDLCLACTCAHKSLHKSFKCKHSPTSALKEVSFQKRCVIVSVSKMQAHKNQQNINDSMLSVPGLKQCRLPMYSGFASEMVTHILSFESNVACSVCVCLDL